jgi:hypothetical protein
VEPGIKYFLLDNFALSMALVLEASTDDIYVEKDEPKSYNAYIDFGIRFFF